MTLRQTIQQILEMLPDIERDRDKWREQNGFSKNEAILIPAKMDSLFEPGPAEQRLQSFLAGLKEEEVRKVQTLMYAGRDGDKDIYGLYDYLRHRFTFKEQVVMCIMEKDPRLQEYLENALELVERLNIDIEDSFERAVHTE